jgi:hypothetical protein
VDIRTWASSIGENVRLFSYVLSCFTDIDLGYCGNIINAPSVNTTLADCNFPCPLDPTEFCGAGNRIEM